MKTKTIYQTNRLDDQRALHSIAYFESKSLAIAACFLDAGEGIIGKEVSVKPSTNNLYIHIDDRADYKILEIEVQTELTA